MFNIETVSAARWLNEAKSLAECLVKFEQLSEPVPFTASPNDAEAHSREIFRMIAEGEAGEVAAYVAPPPAPPPVPASVTKWQAIKVLKGTPALTPAEAAAWATAGTPPDVVQSYINSLPEAERIDALIDFGAAQTFRRDHPIVLAAAAQLNLSETDIDNLFRQAAAL
jgi:hypothetical protein